MIIPFILKFATYKVVMPNLFRHPVEILNSAYRQTGKFRMTEGRKPELVGHIPDVI